VCLSNVFFIRIMCVSNSDNLGATFDLDLLNYFVESDTSFIMEVRHRCRSLGTALQTQCGALLHVIWGSAAKEP